MTEDERELLEQYLTHLNILGEEATHPDFEAWYQEVRYARGQGPRTLRTLRSCATRTSWTPPFTARVSTIHLATPETLGQATPARPLWLSSGSG